MLYEHRSEPLIPTRDFVVRLIRHGGLTLALLGFSLAVGVIGYHELAHMRWVDSFLNASMILGGMGPVGDLPDDASKVFAGIYALYAGILLLAVTGIMIAPVAHRMLHRLHAEDDDAKSDKA